MDDKELKIGATACVAWIAWGMAVGLVVIGWLVSEGPLGQLGIIACGAAATLHVRSFLCKQTLYMTDALDEQEKALRNAFELGRDFEARSRAVTRIPPQPAKRNSADVHQ